MAIRDACSRLGAFSLEECTIYTSCEPCPMCLAAIYWARIERIYYGNTAADAAHIGFDDAELYKQVALPPGQRSIAMLPCLHEEATPVFTEWAEKLDKVEY
jgi:tRNA(Arg) A34 adenosine deaminase TadA